MIKAIINGGLGNQLFQFFATIKFANFYKLNKINISNSFYNSIKNSRRFDILECIDNEKIKKNFNISIQYTNNKTDIPLFLIGSRLPSPFCKLFNILNDKSDFHTFCPSHSLVVGYHQSIFKVPPREIIRKNFLDNHCNLNNYYSVHIRRGDYLLARNSNYGVVSLDSILRVLRDNSAFNNQVFFFSDSPIKSQILSKLTLYEKSNTTFSSDMNLNTIAEFNFMRSSANIVCSNSTFSWWAGFSSINSKRIFLPNRWNKSVNIPHDLIIDNSILYDVDFE